MTDQPTLDRPQMKSVAIDALKNMSPEDRQDVARAAQLRDPGQDATDKIWLIVVSAFVIVFIGAFATLAYHYADPKINLDKLITVFTTVSAFLAGLLAPSPVKNK